MIDFHGKVLLLTGANGAITRAIARTFFELGADLLLSDLDAEGLAGFAADLDPTGGRIATLRQDARSSEQAEALAETCRERFGKADFLVTGAGLYRDQLVDSMSDEQWRETIGINLDGVFFTCRAVAPLLRDGGAIVNIASMAGHRGSYQHAHYSAAKGAVLSFSRSLALELAPRIRVNCVSPGLIDTPLIKPLLAAKGDALIEATPLKRLGTVEEVARTVAFLCSDWAGFVTAETLHVNGGLYVAS
ncbi:MAG: SDR family NAD(P)-dependent oxidoreductase [Tistlia sp.]|uniref:SDR family NAD(P)-dependent oxidoreductase n=1 Tax=Tistlia sp. TaxID=3057121 RepID=UPI0034A2225F